MIPAIFLAFSRVALFTKARLSSLRDEDAGVTSAVARDLRARGAVRLRARGWGASIFRARRPEVDGYHDGRLRSCNHFPIGKWGGMVKK